MTQTIECPACGHGIRLQHAPVTVNLHIDGEQVQSKWPPKLETKEVRMTEDETKLVSDIKARGGIRISGHLYSTEELVGMGMPPLPKSKMPSGVDDMRRMPEWAEPMADRGSGYLSNGDEQPEPLTAHCYKCGIEMKQGRDRIFTVPIGAQYQTSCAEHYQAWRDVLQEPINHP